MRRKGSIAISTEMSWSCRLTSLWKWRRRRLRCALTVSITHLGEMDMIKVLPPSTEAEEYRNTAEILRDLAARTLFVKTRSELGVWRQRRHEPEGFWRKQRHLG